MNIVESIAYLVFLLSGKKPWKPGYRVYKQRKIHSIINNNEFNLSSLKKNYGFRLDERVIEYPWLFSRLPAGKGTLLDAGSALNFNYLLTNKLLQSKRIYISTLAPEASYFPSETVSYIYEDLRDCCFKNNFFDCIVSISTIEHIGFDNTFIYTNDESKKENNPRSYLGAINEFNRILKPKGRLFITVPFGRQKNHGWFQVFDSEMIDETINTFAPQSVNESYFQYESTGWTVSNRQSSRNASCFDINVEKKYSPDFAAFSRAVACLEMTK